MKTLIPSFAVLGAAALVAAARPAAAHPGPVAEVAGHDHWIAGAAIGAAIAVGVWALVRRHRSSAKSPRDGGRGRDATRREG